MKKLFSVVIAVLLVVPLFAETFTVTKQVSEVASEGSWVASTDADNHSYVNFQLDKVVNVSCKAANNGVYWENTTDATKSDWRMYQAREKGEFNFSVAVGYQLKSITLTYSNKNTGVVGLVSGSSIADANQVKSNTKLSLNPRTFSKTLYVANSGTLTNGQARITKFSVEYEPVPVDTMYLNTGGSDLWNQAGAKFSAYYWNDGEEGHFTDFLELAYGETDIFRAIIPHSDSVIFVRHDAAADVPTWKNKWNQTDGEKVEIEDSGNILIIQSWDQGDTEWDHYTPKEPEPNKIYAKNNWAGGDWSWKEMQNDSLTIYSLDSVVYGGVGININTKEDDSEALWFDAAKMAYTADTIKANDTVKIVFNLADSTLTATLLSRPVPPCVDNFGLMIDGSYVPGVYNETSSEWTVLKQDLIAGQKLMMYSYCGETSFAPKQGNFADYMDVNGDTLIVKEDAEYDFYIQLISGNDKLWVVQRKSVTLPRITKAPKSWAGEYAIAAMANDTAIVWTGIDAGQCRDSIKLVDGNLVAQDPVMVVVEAMKDGGYSVKVKGGTNDGKYITQNAAPTYGNGLKFVDNPVRVDITMKDSLVDFFQTISSTQKVYFLYNNAKGTSNERFRFYKDNNYDKYTKLTLFGTPAPSYDYDTVMYVAGNFTNWAEGMKVLPDTVTMPEDSVLAFKQVRVITTKLGETVVKTDTAWFGQQNEGAYMTRENSKDGWTLDGAHNVLLKTDRAGEYVFSLEGESFKVKFPALPGYTYDTLYTIAGNFTNWQDDMQKMPYEVKNVAKDSVLEYKVVRQLITYETGVETKRDTTWLGQPNEGNQMTRESNAWKLDGGYNVKLTADEDGTYTFDFTPNDSVLTVTFPALKPHLDEVNTIAHLKACYEAGTLKDNDTIKVKGYIASMFLKPTNFAKYGSVTIWMTDTLGGKAKEFELYNCYGLEKDTFVYFGPGYNTTGKSNIDVDTIIGRNNVRFVLGDYIEAVGAFKNYSGTFELVQGCNIYEGGEKMVRYAKNNWDAGAETWTWEEMTYVPQKNQFELNNVVYGGTGLNINTVADDADALWIAEADFLGDKVQAKDTVSFVFNPSDSTLTATLIARPHVPVITYDTTMYVAGNFTNWAAGMQKLPYTANLPKDSTIEFKQVRVAVTLYDGVAVEQDTAWYGTPGTEPMTRENSTWLLDGENNVKLTTDVDGEYQFEIVAATGEFKVTWPDKSSSKLDILMMNEQVNKVVVNGQLYIIRNGVMYNATGARIK